MRGTRYTSSKERQGTRVGGTGYKSRRNRIYEFKGGRERAERQARCTNEPVSECQPE